MNAVTRVAAFGAGVAVAFGAAFGIGRVADLGVPGADRAADRTSATGAPNAAGHGHGGAVATSPAADHGAAASGDAAAEAVPGGLQVAQDGYRLVLDHPIAEPVDDGALSFRILGPDNQPLRSYTTTHDKDLHLILARRDLSGFAHLHPRLDHNGTWSVPTSLAPGSWRVFADFDPAGAVGPLTLGADLLVSGPLMPTPLPAPSSTAVVDGYTVTLDGRLTPGHDSRLTLSVSRDGTPVTDLQPYLAAYGHLVALRQGDLAYLHVHPDGAPGDGRTEPGPAIVFHATAPSDGTYRLYLDFKHDGVVRTAEFTVTAGQEAPAHGH
ncbi:hypothetical protein [Phycicoccus sp. Soil803]|uniref:hypothetical protein n=1 Tax=Phycicoccus sp. Soil803 TaxID=1736415 RepID=UPI000708A6E3|nr:hypothetical protein [Phycicoccus sp. Soil803]KRF23204.1 hypothetical protein ASG95_00275 [Phycicoccus sp. Soil803]